MTLTLGYALIAVNTKNQYNGGGDVQATKSIRDSMAGALSSIERTIGRVPWTES